VANSKQAIAGNRNRMKNMGSLDVSGTVWFFLDQKPQMWSMI
jgi:hypothetical protein